MSKPHLGGAPSATHDQSLRRRRPLIGLLLAAGVLLLVAGCRSLDPQPTIDEAHARIAERLELAPTDGDAPTLGAVLDLPTAIEHAWRMHPTLAREVAQLRRDHADWIQADRLPNPTLTIGVGTVLDGGGGSPLRSSLLAPITALITRPARLAAAEATVQAQALRLADTAIDIAEKVTRAAIDVEYHHRRGELEERAATLAAERREIAVASHEAGGASLDEIEKQTVALAAVEDRLTAARMTLEQAERDLLERLGVSGQVAVAPRLPPGSLPTEFSTLPSESDLLGWVALRRYDVAAAIADAESAGARLRVVGVERYGRVGGTIGLDRNFQDREAAVAGIRWEIPLFDQGGARVARAEAERDRKIAIAEEKLSTALLEARKAWLEVTREQERWLAQRDQWIPAAMRRAELAREEWQIGEGSRSTVIEREQQAIAANVLWNESERRLQRALVHLAREAGGTLRPPTLEEIEGTALATSDERGETP